MKRGFILVACLALTATVHGEETTKLDVNAATEEQLMTLPGMSQARAVAVLNYRKANGELIQLEELKLIPQVVPIYDDIEDKLTVD